MKLHRSIRPLFPAVLFAACTLLPENPDRVPSHAVEPSSEVALASVGVEFAQSHGDAVSGFACVPEATAALRWRLLLIDQAEQTIDVQYYIWSGASGNLFLERLLRAADRGVRVRALVDDFTLNDPDNDLAHLGAHPNFELRLFNPHRVRDDVVGQALDALGRVEEVNQRMHNKLFIVDNHLAIVGGRNIGDEYYGIKEGFSYLDMDVVAAGPVVPELSRCFDLYWNSEYSYPADSLLEEIDENRVHQVKREIEESVDRQAEILASFLTPEIWPESVSELSAAMHPGDPVVIWDEVNAEEGPVQVARALEAAVDEAVEEVIIMVAYVIPTSEFIETLRRTVARGVRVTILTNSLASLDSAASNSWYRQYRRDVLRAGVDLFELRPDARDRHLVETPPNLGCAVGMHTKLMIFDRRRVFVGSFNVEPRAKTYNREDAVLIEGASLAGALRDHATLFLDPRNSWRLKLSEKGKVLWESYDGVLDRQPARNAWQRLEDSLIGSLGIPEIFQ